MEPRCEYYVVPRGGAAKGLRPCADRDLIQAAIGSYRTIAAGLSQGLVHSSVRLHGPRAKKKRASTLGGPTVDCRLLQHKLERNPPALASSFPFCFPCEKAKPARPSLTAPAPVASSCQFARIRPSIVPALPGSLAPLSPFFFPSPILPSSPGPQQKSRARTASPPVYYDVSLANTHTTHTTHSLPSLNCLSHPVLGANASVIGPYVLAIVLYLLLRNDPSWCTKSTLPPPPLLSSVHRHRVIHPLRGLVPLLDVSSPSSRIFLRPRPPSLLRHWPSKYIPFHSYLCRRGQCTTDSRRDQRTATSEQRTATSSDRNPDRQHRNVVISCRPAGVAFGGRQPNMFSECESTASVSYPYPYPYPHGRWPFV